MKSFLFSKVFLGSTVILSWLFWSPTTVANSLQTTNKQSSKPSVEYRCTKRNGHPATLAYTSRGVIELIVWKEKYFSGSGYTPQRRCQEVSRRFQQHSDRKNLRYISTGIMNRYKIICVSDKSGNCKSNGLLITLKPNDNPQKVLRDLFNLAARQSGGGINLSGRGIERAITRVRDQQNSFKEMIDIDKYLAESPVIANQADNSNDSFPRNETVSPNSSVTPENDNSSDSNKPVIKNPWENW